MFWHRRFGLGRLTNQDGGFDLVRIGEMRFVVVGLGRGLHGHGYYEKVSSLLKGRKHFILVQKNIEAKSEYYNCQLMKIR